MGDSLLQQCGRCRQDKPPEDYSPSYRGKPGTWCKTCFSAYARGEDVPKRSLPARTCQNPECGVEYVPQLGGNRSMFCSRPCKNATRRTREKARLGPDAVRAMDRAANIKRLYGISVEEYDARLACQGGVCAACGGTNSNGQMLCVDHDHETGAIRGLLCHGCNRGIGLLQDNPDLLRAAAAYLDDWKRRRSITP